MGATGNGAADLSQMSLHGGGLGEGHDQAGASAALRADGAEQIGAIIALVLGLARPGAGARPLPHQPVLLTDPHLVLEPQFDRSCGREMGYGRSQAAWEVFLNLAIASASCAGCLGLALMWEKPIWCRRRDTERRADQESLRSALKSRLGRLQSPCRLNNIR